MAASDSTSLPIKGCIFRIYPSLWLTTGLPNAGAAGIDSEVSLDGGSFADAASDWTEIGSSGTGAQDFTGAEMDTSATILQIKSSTTNAITYKIEIMPVVLASISTGTLSAGSAGGGTLGTVLPYDLTGCYVKTTGGTGGGGTGGANNQARKIVTYNTSSGAFTVAPDWGTTPDATTTYAVLLPPGVTLGMLKALNPATAGRTLVVDASGLADANMVKVGPTGSGTAQTARDIGADTSNLVTRITSTLFAGITSLAQWLGLMAGKQTGDATALTEIKATGAGSGTYNPTTDSTEAIRDRGDAAWVTATGFATASALSTTDGKVDDILADTNELQTDWANGGRLDLLLDAIKAVTDADGGADAVETGISKLQSLRAMLAVLVGAASGADTDTIPFKNPSGGATRVTLNGLDASGNRASNPTLNL